MQTHTRARRLVQRLACGQTKCSPSRRCSCTRSRAPFAHIPRLRLASCCRECDVAAPPGALPASPTARSPSADCEAPSLGSSKGTAHGSSTAGSGSKAGPADDPEPVKCDRCVAGKCDRCVTGSCRGEGSGPVEGRGRRVCLATMAGRCSALCGCSCGRASVHGHVPLCACGDAVESVPASAPTRF